MPDHLFGSPCRPSSASSCRPDQRLLLRDALPRPRDHLRPAAGSSTSPTAPTTCSAPSSATCSSPTLGIGYWPALILAPLDRRPLRHDRRAPRPRAASTASTRSTACSSPSAWRSSSRARFRYWFGVSGKPYAAAAAAHRRRQPRLHVPADLSRLGRRRLARRLPRHLAPRSSRPSSAPISAPRPRTRRWCRPSASTCRCS